MNQISVSVKNVCKNFTIGDDCKIHDRVLILGERVTIGSGVWIGQDCILDGTGGLTIEDGAAVGAGCYIYTHLGRFGKVDFAKPVVVKRGAWLLPRVFVNPGVTIGENSFIYNCSLVTKDVPANGIWKNRALTNKVFKK